MSMAESTGETRPFLDRYDAAKGELVGASLPWLAALREESIARFTSLGLPTRRVEAWKYTDLRPLARAEYSAPSRRAEAGVVLPAPVAEGHRLVFVDGGYRADLSTLRPLPKGARLLPLSAALDSMPDLLAAHLRRAADEDDAALPALNMALMEDGAVLWLEPGVVVEAPIEMLFLAGGGEAAVAYHPRSLIVAEAGSRATVIERHAGSGDYFANSVLEARLGAGASLRHYKLLEAGDGGIHLSATRARLEAEARYDAFVLSASARIGRNEIAVVLDGEGAECQIDGAYMLRGRSHVDNAITIVHAQPRTISRESYKGVLDDRARAIFQGRIVVREDAQKSDGRQVNRTLLLSDTAEIDSKPELEIYADDVKCSHGATTGALDEEALFYMRSRGLPEDEARGILVGAFVNEVIDDIADETVRADFTARAAALLSQWERVS